MAATYIKAGAGSGKTHKLTHDLSDLLTREKDPVDASRIILTTFTKAAAADFIRKAREVLIAAGKPDKAAELDSAAIGTVHSVCEQFVRKYWYRLGLTLPLNIISGEDQKLYVSRTAETVASDPDVLYFSAFAREFEMNPDFWKDYLKEIIEKKYSFGVKDLADSCRISCEDIGNVFSGPEAGEAEKACVDGFLTRISKELQAINARNDASGKKRELESTMKEATGLLLGASTWKKAEKARLWAAEGAGKTKGFWAVTFSRAEYDAVIRDATRILLSQENGRKMQECIQKLFGMAGRWEEEYLDFKKANNLLDFNDLEQKFLRILYEEGFSDVREDIGKSYDVLMVDEFQDSNPVQIDIFRKLMELVGESVFVGDPKQAIYGFRGTESSLVEEFAGHIPVRKSLRKSFRSRPELVRAANDLFCQAFHVEKIDIVDPDDENEPYDGVSLYPMREPDPNLGTALQHWELPLKNPKSPNSRKPDYKVLGRHIRSLVESKTILVVDKDKKDENGNPLRRPIRYRDIALLLRNNDSQVAAAFREAGLPVSVQEKEFVGWAEVQLILSLIRYVANPADLGAKADILHLVGGKKTEDIILDRLDAPEGSPWMKDTDLFKYLDDIRIRVGELSIPEIVDTLILELDLYNHVKQWGLADTRSRNIGLMAELARKYVQHCSGLNTAPSLMGYVDHAVSYTIEGNPVDTSDTVKILTYHSAKGLEWPMVILDELDSLSVDEQTIWRKEVGGVRNYRPGETVLLHVFPAPFSISSGDYGSKANLPQPILDAVKKLDIFGRVKNRKVEEEGRLLYVGFTRARDYLVTVGTDKTKYTWLTECGAGGKGDSDEGHIILWHAEHPSTVIKPDVACAGEAARGDQDIRPWTIPSQGKKEEKEDGNKEEEVGKYLSPSTMKPDQALQESLVLTPVPICGKMEQQIAPGHEATCGTCIHNIFAAFDPDAGDDENEKMAARVIDGAGLAGELTSPRSIIAAIREFYAFLTRQYGEGVPLKELPVIRKNGDGTILRGEMDLVWKLPDGKCVLVDFKSYDGEKDYTDPDASEHYQDYAGQLKSYRDCLTEAEWTVLDTLIFYHVQGRAIRFENL